MRPSSVRFSSVAQSCPTLFATPWIAARQDSLSITNSQSSLRLTSIEWVMPSSHFILCHPLLLLPPVPPSIRVFSNESTLRMRWQANSKQYMNRELPDVHTGFRKGRGTKNQVAKIWWIIKKAREFQKKENIYFALLTTPTPLTVWITTNCGKFWKRWEYQTTLPASWEICMQVKKQQLEQDTEQTGSKLGKDYIKVVYCHPAY